MDLPTFRWLLTADGQRLLEQAASAYADHDGDPVRAASALRGPAAPGSSEPARTAAALTQVRLRDRAAHKLGADAARMYFTPDALEQATRGRVAAHRATRLAGTPAASVVDLGCGAGGDLVAFARAGLRVVGVDADPLRAAIAAANLRALGLAGTAEVGDAQAVDRAAYDAAFVDPARRTGAGRAFRVADWTPPWSFVEELLGEAAVVKTAPGIPHRLVPDGVEAEWVSDEGEVKEAALWSAPLATAKRRATLLGPRGPATLTDADDPGAAVRELGGYVYEPDGAVIRAGLVTAVAAAVDGGLVDPRIAWVTGDRAHRTPFARGYRVLDRLPFREKRLRAALRARGVGPLTVKTRGVDISPDEVRRRLALRGDTPAVLVLTRVAGSGAALLVEPL